MFPFFVKINESELKWTKTFNEEFSRWKQSSPSYVLIDVGSCSHKSTWIFQQACKLSTHTRVFWARQYQWSLFWCWSYHFEFSHLKISLNKKNAITWDRRCFGGEMTCDSTLITCYIQGLNITFCVEGAVCLCSIFTLTDLRSPLRLFRVGWDSRMWKIRKKTKTFHDTFCFRFGFRLGSHKSRFERKFVSDTILTSLVSLSNGGGAIPISKAHFPGLTCL